MFDSAETPKLAGRPSGTSIEAGCWMMRGALAPETVRTAGWLVTEPAGLLTVTVYVRLLG